VASSGVQGQHATPWVCDLSPFIKYFERKLAQWGHDQEKSLQQIQVAKKPDPQDPAEAMVWSVCGRRI
jgi:hypothetical protein